MNFSIWNKFILSLFLIFSISTVCNAQEFIYEAYGVDQGLPSSQIYDAYQTKDGHIWFATDKGLSRYNGYEFENFDTNDGLTGNVVLRFYPQQNDQIWCYSYHSKSLFYFDEIFKGFKAYKYNNVLAKNLNSNSVVKSIYIDLKGNLHIGGHHINGALVIDKHGNFKKKYASKEYFLYDSSLKKYIVLEKTIDSRLYPYFFTTEDTNKIKTSIWHSNYKSGRIMAEWMVPNETGIVMSDSTVLIAHKNKENITLTNNYSPIGIKVIDNNHFFMGYQFGGGRIVNKKGKVLRHFLNGKSLTDLLIDHEGGYWFTTLNSGVYYVKKPSMHLFNNYAQKDNHINSLAKIKNNELLVAYNNGNIFKVLKNQSLLELDGSNNNKHGFVESSFKLNEIYHYNGRVLRNSKQKDHLLESYILKISEPIDSSIFVSTDGLFYEIIKNEVINSYKLPYRVHDVTVWNKDTILATPQGVFKFKNGTKTALSEAPELYNYRSDDIDVSIDKEILIVATQNAGVVINDGTQVYNITIEDGLYSNIVNEVVVENDSTYWACTNKGINKIELEGNDYRVSGINKEHGLISNEIEDLEIINDTVWVGTKQGLCSFPKNLLDRKTTLSKYFKLKNIYINGKLQKVAENNTQLKQIKNHTLSHTKNDISFVVEGISFANKTDLHYQYRLNKNSDWISTKERQIKFPSLSPNTYFFEAKMCIGDQSCSEKIISYQFTILPPFWKQGWFIVLCIILFGFLIYLFFKIQVLTYNKGIVRELIRLLIKRLKRKEKFFCFREDGKDVRITTHHILYIKSAGNYIDIHTKNKTHTVRMNIGKFLYHVPDKLEYVRVHRSYIVRIDKITSKSKNEVCIGHKKIPVSQSYLQNLKQIHF